MKNIILASTILLLGTAAFAGQGSCKNSSFSCSSVYQLFYDSTLDGPSVESAVVDRQPNPYLPRVCGASVILGTEIGVIILNYEEVSGKVSGLFDYFGTQTPIETDKALKTSVRTTKPGDISRNDALDNEFVHVSCKVIQK